MKIRKTWAPKKITVEVSSLIVGAVLFAVGGFFIGSNWPNIKNTTITYLTNQKTTDSRPNWNELDSLYNQLRNTYDGDINNTKLISGTKKGLVSALGDEYTVFMDKTETADFQKSLHGDIGAGVGIEMGLRNNLVTVLRTLPDNPAGRAGVLAGDIIYKVNDEDVHNLNTEGIAKKLRGENGTEVKLTVLRKNAEHTFNLIREKINNTSAYVTYDNKTAIITVSRFDNNTGTLVQSFAKDFANKGITKVILDLRNNGGGYVDAAVDLLSLWIDNEKILIQKSKHNGEKITKSHANQAILKNTKTVVLINGASASASEIVAGALKDYKKATLVGEKSYGKGVVQSLYNLPMGETLKVTTARWYTPLDHSINKTGIEPDQTIERTFDDINAGKDPQLDAAKKI